VYGWYSDKSVFLEDAGLYLRPGVYSVVVLEESPCPRGSSPISDVKRGQNLEAKAEAIDKVTNKKYQMMVYNIQANLYHYDQNDTA